MNFYNNTFSLKKLSIKNIIYFSFFISLFLISLNAFAQSAPTFNDYEIKEASCQLMDLMGGAMGALLTAVAGVGALVGAAFGAYRAATSLITVAVSAYILPTLVSLWFGNLNCVAIEPGYLDSVNQTSTETTETIEVDTNIETQTIIVPDVEASYLPSNAVLSE